MPIIKGSSSITCRGRTELCIQARLCRRAPIGKQHQMLDQASERWKGDWSCPQKNNLKEAGSDSEKPATFFYRKTEFSLTSILPMKTILSQAGDNRGLKSLNLVPTCRLPLKA